MKNRTMTENDAIRELEWAKNRLMQCSHMDSNRAYAFSMAFKAFENEAVSRKLLEAAAEEIENLYGRDTNLSKEIRDFLKV